MVHAVSNNYSKLAGNTSEEYICFRGCMVPSMFFRDTHVGLEMIALPFYRSPYLIEGIPFRSIALDAREHAEFHVFISVSGPAFFRSAVGIFAFAESLPFDHMNLWAAPFDTVRTSFLFCEATVFHGKGRIVRTCRVAIFVPVDFFEGALVTQIVRDQCSFETKIRFEEAINTG